MESIRRKIKIFWREHSDPIIFYSSIIIGIILITQFLNKLAIEKKENEINTNNENIIIEGSYSSNTKNKELIEDFINYCKENKTQEAYKLLSNKCKDELYQTYEVFMNEYYNKIFSKKRIIQIEYEAETQLYKIIFYSDLLESGGFTKSINDYYKIEQDIIENKIYINFYKNIK